MQQQLITLKEVSEMTAIPLKTLYGYINKGVLPGCKFGNGKKKLIRIKLSSLLDWIDNSEIKK